MGSKKGKTRQWAKRQERDPYVLQAKSSGYRARSAFKLIELQEKYRLFKPGYHVLDLGAAPGGWSQVAKNYVGQKGLVFAVDRLSIEPIEGVTIYQGDLEDDDTLAAISDSSAHYNLVISDMAPNLTGIPSSDQARMIGLAELALDVAMQKLVPQGTFVLKLFQGVGFEEYIKLLRTKFKKVAICKPKSSRPESHEVYCVATGYNKEQLI